ncbi:MAG TPA: DUF4194 domain-containing protein [Chitinophagales bacterium]|nr:DUF4194 domain-containing protein [Chitinophagales bacterium]
MTTVKAEAYASVIVKLLQSVIYDDDKKYWNDVINYETSVRDYFGKIGIDVIINRQDGYAFLKQAEFAEDDKSRPIQLIRKIPLTYETTLLCVLLREWLDENEVKMQTDKLYVTSKQVKERIDLFFKDKTNRKRLLDKLDTLIKQAQDLGFLHLNQEDKINNDNSQYEVKRIIKAKISNEKLEELKIKLKQHVESV